MIPITHVIFDLDGTLPDTEPLYFRAFQQVLAPFGVEFTEELDLPLRGLPTAVAVPRLLAQTGVPLAAEEFIERVEGILFGLYPAAPPTAGAIELTDHLRAHGIPYAIGTSSTRRALEVKLQRHAAWRASFAAVVCLDDVGRGKPAPDIFQEAARRMDAAPECCLVFEDAGPGVAAARAAGMRVVGIAPPELDAPLVDADLVVRSLAAFEPAAWGLPPPAERPPVPR